MKKIIDASALRSDEIRSFLSSSSGNQAVLCDYAAMESFKGDATINLRRSLAIVAEFPNQIIILKSTREISRLRPRRSGLHGRFRDDAQTRGFASYCRAMLRGAADADHVDFDIHAKAKAASTHFDALAEGIDVIRDGMRGLAQSYKMDDLRDLRTGRPISGAFSERIVQDIFRTAVLFIARLDPKAPIPSLSDAQYSYPFRYAMCVHGLVLKWIAEDGYQSVSADRLKNDVTDMTYAAYGTLYDGVISCDKKLLEIYRLGRWILDCVIK